MVDPKESLEERLNNLDLLKFGVDHFGFSALKNSNDSHFYYLFLSDFADLLSEREHFLAITHLKSTLARRIYFGLKRYSSVGENFDKTLGNTLNKAELGLIYNGLVSFNYHVFDPFRSVSDDSSVLKTLFSKLTDWEKVYFLAGSWETETQDVSYYLSKSLYENVEELVKVGVDSIHKSHMNKKNKGIYKRSLKLPESQYYRKS